MKKTGLTKEDHERIGERLKAIRCELIKLSLEFAKAYPIAGNKPYSRLQKAEKAVSQAKHYAEEIYCKEHPGIWTTKAYFGVKGRGKEFGA